MAGNVAPGMSEESLIYEQRHAWVLHCLFLAAPIAVGGFMFLWLLKDAADMMVQHDASFAEVVGISARIGLVYPTAAAVLHGTATSLILQLRPWTVNRVATVHGGVLVAWVVLFYLL